ncbi:MAG: VanZ family protein [Clostridia bacterium]|nr:VanZ family protein [Clostridia bacterium]
MQKILFGILMICWMVIVFIFSSQPATDSSKESGRIVEKILSFSKKYNEVKETQKQEIYSKVEKIVRKMAHFSLYMIGGVIIFLFMNTFNIPFNKKIISTILIGVLYASSDEFHQLFVQGRSGQITDVIIDSMGIIVGLGLISGTINSIGRY